MIKNNLLLTVFLFVSLFYFRTTVQAATFTVSNLNDTGTGSLRQAITDANAAGSGGHLINFSVSGTIPLASNLPTISNDNITIDGVGQSIVVSANGGDIARYVFRGNAGADFLTVQNLEIKNTGYEAFRFDGSPTDITIENVKWYNDYGNYYNFGIYFVGNAINLTIRNVIAEDQQNYGAVLEITGYATGLMVDNLTFDNTFSFQHSVEVIRIAGAATNCTIQNSNFNLDNGLSTNDSDYGIYFYNTVTDCVIKNVNILNCEVYGIYARLKVDGLDLSNVTITNGDGYGGAQGIHFNYPVYNLNMDTIVIDMDHTNSTDDGNYGIYFRYDAINVDIDSLEIHDGEIYNMYIGRAATNFTMKRARLDNFNGYTAQQSLRFEGNATNVTLTDVVIDGDVTGTTNDGDYGLLFISKVNTDVTLTNVSVNEFDVDGFYMFEIDNLIMDGCTASNNLDGMEYYGGYDRSNNSIKNCIFSDNTRGGLVINNANATNQIDIDSCVFSGNQYGAWLYSTGGIKEIQFRDNTFFDNTITGLRNEQADGVLYARNNMWNNGVGIDNVANNGNNDLENADGDVPVLLSSVNIGGGNYEVTFTLPSFCNTSDCDVEIFTNKEDDIFLNGREYQAVFNDLGAGSNTVTVSSNGNTKGFWTATLKVATLNNSVSEFSDPLTIQPKFPAGVGNGIALWMSADEGVTENVAGNTITEWKDRAGIHTPIYYNSDPDKLDDVSDLINFNPTVDFDGNDYIRWDGDFFHNGFTSAEIFLVNQEEGIGINSVNGHPFDFGGGGASYYTYSNNYIYEDFGSNDRKVWKPSTGTISLSEGTANGATFSGPIVNTLDYNIYNVKSETNNWHSAFNGITAITDVTNTVNFTGTPLLGARSSGVFYGRIPEIVLYNRALDQNERERVNTYLAIKYGLTLGHNYYASDWDGASGTTLWTIGSGYDNDIAGIGRDDNGSLFQNQSKSINDSTIVTIYNADQSGTFPFPASNALNVDTPSVDKSFLLWGNNDSIQDFGTAYTPNSFTLPSGAFFFHMERIWNVKETGTIGAVTVSVPATTAAEHLLVHNSADFGTGTPDEYELLNDGDGNLYAIVDFNDGDFFTFGALRTAPGCVPLGLNLWLRPDLLPEGNVVNGIGWDDYSGNDNDFTAVASDPLVVSGGLNFNNYVAFDAGDYFSKTSMTTAYTAGEVFSVLSANGFTNDGHGYSFGGNSNTHYAYSNNAIYESFGTSDRIGWVPNTGVITDAHSGLTINTNTDINLLDWNIYNTRSDLNLWETSFNGFLNAYTSTNTVDFSNTNNYVGRGNQANWTGNEAEVILYNRVLSDNERERVNTYLALKYGKTLYHDYLSGNSTMLWDSSALATYHNDVAGIGRDKCQGFYQRQSQSINDGVVVSIYNGNQMDSLPLTNAANTSTLSVDNSFMLWGNNGSTTDYTTSHTLASTSSPCIYIMDRIWTVKETGTVGTVTVQGPEDAEYLLVHTTTAFGAGTTEIPLVNGRGTHDFSDGDFFTFGKLVTAPGGVLAGVGAWWRGDVGADASNWIDYSGNGFDAYSINTVTPDFGGANYNPMMSFNSSYYRYTSDAIFATPNNYDNMYVFSVGIPKDAEGLFIWGERANNGYDVRFYKNASNHIAASAPYGYHLGEEFTGNNGVNNVPNLMSFQKTTTDMTTYVQGDTAQNVSGTYNSYYSTGAINYIGAIPGYSSTGGSSLSEVIIYKDASSMTATEIQQINSYLALKYGITIGQSTPTDYLASDGVTKMWDATAGLIYNNDIAGIGRDDCSNLNQKQSKSINQESLVAIGLGSIVTENANNTDTFLLNKDFLVWGNDNAGTAIISTDLPASFAGCAVRLAQEWMVQENGSVSNLAMEFGGNAFKVPNGATNFSIFIDTDGNADFTDGSPTIVAADSVSADGIAYFSGLDLNDNDKFTFGWNMNAPGGVFATNQVNGVHYKYYKDIEYNIESIESELIGEGYVANMTNPDDIMANEDADFTLEFTTDLEITTSGDYTFRLVSLDDNISIYIDGINYLNGSCCTTVTGNVISLAAGKHAMIIRYGDVGSTNTLNLQYNGPDNGNTWAAIPDDVLFVDPSIALWLKADGNVTNTGDGTTATEWKDQSGKGNDVTTTEGVPLFYSSTSTELLNFNPSINFQDDAMDGPDNLNGFAFDKQGRTVFAVTTPSTTSGQNYIFSQGRDAVTSAHYGMLNYSSNFYQVGWSNDVIAYGEFEIGKTKLMTMKQENYNINAVNNGQIFVNGFKAAEGSKNLRTQWNDNEDLVIGDVVDGAYGFNGNIAEVIYYPWDLTTQEREQVESYLGMKYAITQAHDYYSSAGVLLWDSSAMGVYHNSIAAIARDDCQGLYQKQSKSVDDGTIVTMYNGSQAAGFPVSNAANTSTIDADFSYMLYGHNDSSATYANIYTPHSFTVPIGSFFYTMERVWNVVETGTVGTVTVTIPATMRAEYMIVHNSDDFNTGTPTEIQMQSDGAGNLYAVLDLTDGQYFTFGFTQKAPGCVGSGLQLWLLPDDLPAGVLTSGWADNSFLLNDFTTVTATPSLVENGLNFNNYVEFNTGDYLSKTNISSSFTAGEVFSMIQSNSASTSNGTVFHLGGGGAGSHYTWSNGAVYEFFGTTERFGWNPSTGAVVDAKTGTSVVGSSVDVLDWNIYNVHSGAGDWATAFNGETQASSNTNTVSFTGVANNYIGSNGTNNWNGNNAETILYDRVLTSTEREQVNTYIALKYGVTLYHDYISGDGSLLWDSSALAIYHNDVAGIGREDCGGLHQKQSKSINPSSIVTIGNVKIEESNALNTNEILEDTTYLIWGHDNAGFGFQTTDMPSIGFSCGGRIAQEWKVQEKGNIDDVSLQIGGDTFSIPSSANNVSLFIDTDGNGDFTDGTPSIIESDSVSNGIAYFSQLDFNNNDVFTIGWSQFAPGGVVENLEFWLKADAGIADTTAGANVTTWEDQSINGHIFDDVAQGGPYFTKTRTVNFNPSVEWNNNGTEEMIAHNVMPQGPVSEFAVAVWDNPSNTLTTVIDMTNASNDVLEPTLAFDNSSVTLYDQAGGGQLLHGGSVVADQPVLMDASFTHGVAGVALGLNGLEVIGSNTVTMASGLNKVAIGNTAHDNNMLNGLIPEGLGYSRELTVLENQKVRTYLSVKYGLTLEDDYISSNGTLLWDSSALATYHNDVAGIGIDSCSGLFQKQSKSENSDAIVTMYNGDHIGFLPTLNMDNTDEFTVNNSFLIWGNNNLDTTYTGSYPTNTYIDIMERVWHVEEIGTVGNITLTVDNSSANVLIVDADGDFTDGNSVEYVFSNGEILHDFNDGEYFTFGMLICKEVATVTCPSSTNVDLTSYITAYTAGGTWTDESSSGVDISDPTDVDFSGAAVGSYSYKYIGIGGTCDIVNVERLVVIPAPEVDDVLICEGGVTQITIPAEADRLDTLYQQDFSGSQGYILRSKCSGSNVSTCYTNDQYKFTNVGLQLDAGTNFAAWNTKWYTWVHQHNNLRFGRMKNQEVSLTTDSAFTLLPGETANFSGQSARWWGTMDVNDYVQFWYVVDGVETMFANRTGTLSTTLQTSQGSYTNNTAVPQEVEMRVKVKNSWNEAHYIDNLMITKELAPPVFTFYDDADLTVVLASGTGESYDPMTVAGTIDTIYVTRTENGCESIADTVTVEVSPNNVTPMAGEDAFYCTGGVNVDLTAQVSNYQAGGTWSDDESTGVDLTDPTSVDVSGLADGSYNFTYTLNGISPCNGEMAVITVHIGLQPTPPIINDINTCEGGSTIIALTPAEDEVEVLYNQTFDGYNGGYNLWSRCTSNDINSCRNGDLSKFTSRGLTVDTSATDFSNWTSWYTWVYDNDNLRFGRLMDEEIVLSTDSFTLLAGEMANFSGDSRRYFGTLEAGDYVKFFYVVDGVETEFDSRDGNISTAFSTSSGFYENNTALPVNVQLRVKVKNSYGEGHIVDNLKITKTLNKPINNFYSDAGLTSLLATGYSYDPATAAGSTDTVYVTNLLNSCESIADTVYVTVDSNDIVPMDGGEIFICDGSSVDLTLAVTTYVTGGIWTDIDSSGANLADSTAVDFSFVANGSYNFSYKLAGSCADEEAIVTVHVGFLGGDPYVVADGAVSTALTECQDANWIYFVDPNDDSRRIAAINTNGNPISPSDFTVTVDVDAPATDLERATGTGTSGKAVELMRRQVQINCPTCANLSPAVDVRLYWESTEKSIAGVAMDALMAANSITGTKYWEWFKVSHDVADIPANLSSDGIADVSGTSHAWSTPSSSGTESNGVEYVQFDGITDFSTFGGGWFVNQPDATILPVELVKLEAKPIDNKYIEINWETATEINNEGFQLLRSTDGVSFDVIAWFDGAGNSSETITYLYEDHEVQANTYYYRLKQFDFDGNTSLSPIVNASITSKENNVFVSSLFPNPTNNNSKLVINTNEEQDVKIVVYDIIGRKVYSKNVLLDEGQNHILLRSKSLSAGVYSVLILREGIVLDTLKWGVNSK